MKRALFLLLALGACTREVDLGAVGTTTEGSTVSGGCRSDGDCATGQRCLNGACTVANTGCGNQETCATSAGSFCTDACPSCTAGERCCTDNGFGQCQCFCALSCSGPSCAPAGTDPGPAGASCSSASDCLCGETCNGGICQAGPTVTTCSSAFDCQNNGCGTDQCQNGRCVSQSWRCVNDRECGNAPSGLACSSGACACISRAGTACTDSSACAACAGESCRAGFCSVFTSTAGATGSGTGTSGAVTGGTTGGNSSGTTSGGSCACDADADCNDAFHTGYVCSNGFCVAGPSTATLSSTGGACAGPQSSGSSSGTGTVGSGSGSGSVATGTSGTT